MAVSVRQVAAYKLIPTIGCGEAGKSTILKQLCFHYGHRLSSAERNDMQKVILSNLLVAFQIIITEIEEAESTGSDMNVFSNEVMLVARNFIQQESEDDSSPSAACLDAMKLLWQDHDVQKTIERGNEYALFDNFD